MTLVSSRHLGKKVDEHFSSLILVNEINTSTETMYRLTSMYFMSQPILIYTVDVIIYVISLSHLVGLLM